MIFIDNSKIPLECMGNIHHRHGNFAISTISVSLNYHAVVVVGNFVVVIPK